MGLDPPVYAFQYGQCRKIYPFCIWAAGKLQLPIGHSLVMDKDKNIEDI